MNDLLLNALISTQMGGALLFLELLAIQQQCQKLTNEGNSLLHYWELSETCCWCLEPESNRHGRYISRGILSPLRLPIPPPRQFEMNSEDFTRHFKRMPLGATKGDKIN